MKAIHHEVVPVSHGPLDRISEYLGHHHHRVVRMTWTVDDSLWSTDPNALEYCECGATRRIWGPSAWLPAGFRREP